MIRDLDPVTLQIRENSLWLDHLITQLANTVVRTMVENVYMYRKTLAVMNVEKRVIRRVSAQSFEGDKIGYRPRPNNREH